ncbi:LolA family protein [Myceligenerans indicum]|uniref:Outer membrane lipoprotein carrier protein LolA n=1 Tax=Myceligenerans indicum TaxID=2593663 RepID=A0ABS1LJM8_9MICO|nr:outer membrane lipoprotein carrier protein LolA [Myceligenerans indicum]MBL0886445.1 outer membrane lipoprotein carrier protein LolA [Myceligenerans indicum]
MRPRTKALVAAGSGIAAGFAGLALGALPAGADEDPVLPEIDAEQLVASTLEARPPAFDGVAEVSNDLGLPVLPGTGPVSGADVLDADSVRVFHDGAESTRIQVERPASELTVVKSPGEVWAYDSQESAAKHFTWDDTDAAAAREHAASELADPSQAAARLVEQLRATSDIFVDGTARVADRAAYELVLTPKPTEKTLLREITVAIDDETRVPLRVEVYVGGSTEPVLSLGFVRFEVGAQDADLFDFTPPAGTDVETTTAGARSAGDGTAPDAEDLRQRTTTVGDGWDTVVIGQAPADGASEGPAGDGQDARAFLEQIGRPVSGEFGSGTFVQVAVGGAVITDDGRIAAGAVPQQVLVDALDQQ